jgi:hypothetical protein
MHCILLWTSYFRSIQFYCLLSVLYIFQFLSVLLIVTDLVSVSCFKSCKFGQFFGTGTNRWCLGENNVYQNGEWRFYVSWIGSCYVTSNVSYLLCEIWGTHIGVAGMWHLSLSEWIPTFWRFTGSLSSGSNRLLFRVKQLILFGLLDPENKGAMVLQNSRRHLRTYWTSHPRRMESTFG